MSLATLCSLADIADQLSLTVLKVSDDSFMAVIQPSLKLAEKYPQLASPLQVQASAAALDAEVANAIQTYQPALKSAVSNLSQIEQELKEAQKSARDKAKNRTTSPATPAGATGTTTSAAKPSTPMQPISSAPPELPDLFSVATDSPEQGRSTRVLTDDLDELPLPDLEG